MKSYTDLSPDAKVELYCIFCTAASRLYTLLCSRGNDGDDDEGDI